MLELVKSKQTGEPFTVAAPPRPTNVVSLMDALRRSIAAEKAEEAVEPKRAPSKARAAASTAKEAKPRRKKA